MAEKRLKTGSKAAILDLNSSFIDWERSLIAGHPIHPVGGVFPLFMSL